MLTYIVYRQDIPLPTGRKLNRYMEYDKRGEYDEHEANLVALGHITAASNAEAWDKAHRMTRKPVLEEIKQ
jgi:hypothetical protein